MTQLFYYLILLSAVMCVPVALAVFWRNRYQAAGVLLCAAMMGLMGWLIGFAQYYRPWPNDTAMRWAMVTLTATILLHPLWFHTACALSGVVGRYRLWIVAGYAFGVGLLIPLWGGGMLEGLKHAPFMDHYVRYNRFWYSILGGHLLFWQAFGVLVMTLEARRAIGYRQTQLIYYIVAWFVVFMTTHSIILPLEYGVNIAPFGFFLLPVNLVMLAYVMGAARLADHNVVLVRVLLYGLTLVLVAGVSLFFVWSITYVAPHFMTPQQAMLTVALMAFIGILLSIVLPQWLPRVEQAMHDRLLERRVDYLEKLTGMSRELSLIPTVEQVLDIVARNVKTHMQLSRVLFLLENPLSGSFQMETASGLTEAEPTEDFSLGDQSHVIRYIRQKKTTLVRDELGQLVDNEMLQELTAELNRLGTVVCLPMILDGKLMGIMCLGEKLSKEMFYASDLQLLANLADEVALAVKYRHIEEQAIHHNKLIMLGTLAAGIAHEVRNPLSSIRTFAQLLPTRINDPDFTNEFSKIVVKDVDRITRVIQSMLSFARPGTVNIGNYSASELIDEALILTQSRLRSKKIQVTKLSPDPLTLCVDKQQILQVLLNIINNAVDALPDGGEIRITTGTHQAEGQSELPNQRFGVIEISDSGPGIPAAVRGRLFDPFFTTKHDGTGLGLSISQKIIRDHNGYITVSSVEGLGAAFQVHLPLD